jgi:hypothetical protein
MFNESLNDFIARCKSSGEPILTVIGKEDDSVQGFFEAYFIARCKTLAVELGEPVITATQRVVRVSAEDQLRIDESFDWESFDWDCFAHAIREDPEFKRLSREGAERDDLHPPGPPGYFPDTLDLEVSDG